MCIAYVTLVFMTCFTQVEEESKVRSGSDSSDSRSGKEDVPGVANIRWALEHGIKKEHRPSFDKSQLADDLDQVSKFTN